MKTFQPLRAIFLVWLIMMVVISAGVLAMNGNRRSLLHIIGAPGNEDRNLSGTSNFLGIRDSYARLLDRFQANNPSNEPRAELANDPDFKKLALETEKIKNNAIPAVPIEFVLSDVYWMAGLKNESTPLLSAPFRKAGLTNPLP